jgi:capsid protein
MAKPGWLAALRFGYDAVKETRRRKAPQRRIAAESVILRASDRKKLLATAQNQQRNSSLAAAMVRKHLDYVSRFKIQVDTGDEKLDALLLRIFRWHARPENFDIAARLGREEAFRLFELEKTVSGDAALLKLSTGHLQAIESDLIAYPKNGAYNHETKRHERLDTELLEGVDKDTGCVMDTERPGRVAQYCICNRLPDGKDGDISFDHLEDAENVIFDAYYSRFASQVRGVSPLATAINAIQDVYESIDYNLAKAKIHALFGIAIMRDYAGNSGMGEAINPLQGALDAATGDGEPTEELAGRIRAAREEMRPNDMLMLDMETSGRIDTIESKTPSAEFRDFTETVIRIALLALDIPYSAFDSSKSTFAGLIADTNLYEYSAQTKRDKNRWKRQEYSDWLLEREWHDPDSAWRLREAAARAGVESLREIQGCIEWIPAGTPWLQKIQEVEGDMKAISIGLDNPVDAARRRGGDVFENIRKTARVYAFAKEHDVPLTVGLPGQTVIEEEGAAETEKQDDAN